MTLKTNGFVPEGRGGHEAVLLKNTIYFMGGSRAIPNASPFKNFIRGYNLSNEVFYLDLTSSFSTTSPPYVDLTGTPSRLPYGNEKDYLIRTLGTALIGGPSNDEILLVGGVQQDLTLLDQIDHNSTISSNQTLMINSYLNTWNSTNQTIFIYRPTARIWMTPGSVATFGAPQIRRRSTSTVIVNGVIYIFGGRAQTDTDSPTFICFNDLFTYDTILSRWGKINAANVPTPRSHSAAVLLPDARILYIGGVSQTNPGEPGTPIDMKEIQVFDTVSSSWSSKQAIFESTFIQPRSGHTANLAPDNKSIIIIGGSSSYVLNESTAKPVLVLLDISKEPYTYSELKKAQQVEIGILFNSTNSSTKMFVIC
ncbi:20521_t:CDS:2 [Cetraspora pellucida]|uniref:20521_t:CDS:1 n=1 Tax=Cetraspora pellucida TaxID=1433469 RepID=A0A9N9IHK0_9GLOM|nr:20521_t:CDS:2 [Cetraspora pellucida]